jgi:hypothetical protein
MMYMMSRTKSSDLLEIKEKVEQAFNKVVMNPNFAPMVTGFALTTVAGIALSLSSGDLSQPVYATHAIFWMRPPHP